MKTIEDLVCFSCFWFLVLVLFSVCALSQMHINSLRKCFERSYHAFVSVLNRVSAGRLFWFRSMGMVDGKGEYGAAVVCWLTYTANRRGGELEVCIGVGVGRGAGLGIRRVKSF